MMLSHQTNINHGSNAPPYTSNGDNKYPHRRAASTLVYNHKTPFNDDPTSLPGLDSYLKQMIAQTSNLHPVFKKYKNPLVGPSLSALSQAKT